MSPVRISKIKDAQTKLLMVIMCSSIAFGVGVYEGKQIADANAAAEAALKAQLEKEQKRDDISEEIKAITKMLEEVNHANHGR